MRSEPEETKRYILLASFLLIVILIGLFTDGIKETFTSFMTIQTISGRLIQDFTTISIGGALLNAAIVAIIGMALVFFSSVTLAGPTIAAIFTMFGFGLFGKTALNISFIILGVFIASKIANKSFGAYSLIALFGTALGPVVTYVMFDLHLPLLVSIPSAILSGIVIGVILPSIAGVMLSLHQGYNLYNIGFSCGFMGLFISSFFHASRQMSPITITWNSEVHWQLHIIIPLISIMSILFGFITSKQSIIKSIKEVKGLQSLVGRLPTDFFDLVESETPFINMGVLGLLSYGYVNVVGGNINGPMIAGIATVMGFGSFGKSVKNSYPLVVGVILATLLFGKSLNAPGPMLAALFSTTLAPIAGQFGPIIGIIAGMIHLIVVESSAAWHGGFDLYNNGFAGGLSATLVISIIHWYQSNKKDEDFNNET